MPIQEKNRAWFLPRPKPDKYKGGMPLHCEEWLIQEAEELLARKLKEKNILNLFCGMNKYGYRIDINPEVKPDLIADAHDFVKKLPFAISRQEWKFDLIIADPPYSTEESKELYRTGKLNYKKWTKKADRVLKKGGLLCVYHKYIMPNPDPEKYEVARRIFIGNRTYHLPRVAIFFRKKNKKEKLNTMTKKIKEKMGTDTPIKRLGIKKNYEVIKLLRQERQALLKGIEELKLNCECGLDFQPGCLCREKREGFNQALSQIKKKIKEL